MLDITPYLQFGFAGVFAVLLFVAYQKLQEKMLQSNDKMLQVIVQNSTALQNVANVMDQFVRVQDKISKDVDVLWDHVHGLETCTHGPEGHAFCPYQNKLEDNREK